MAVPAKERMRQHRQRKRQQAIEDRARRVLALGVSEETITEFYGIDVAEAVARLRAAESR